MDREAFLKSHARLIERPLRKAQTGVPVLEGQLSEKAFSQALYRSVERRFRDADSREREIATYLESLHIEDLALACACGEGPESFGGAVKRGDGSSRRRHLAPPAIPLCDVTCRIASLHVLLPLQ